MAFDPAKFRSPLFDEICLQQARDLTNALTKMGLGPQPTTRQRLRASWYRARLWFAVRVLRLSAFERD